MLFGLHSNALRRLIPLTLRPFSVSVAVNRHGRTLVDRTTRSHKRRVAYKVNTLLMNLGKQIPDFEDDPAKLTTFMHDQLSSLNLTKRPLRRSAFDSAINLLIENRRYAEAILLYERMLDEDLPPSPTTNATITALSIVASQAPQTDLLDALAVTLADSHYSEPSLMQLLDFLAKLSFPIAFRMQVARQFIKSRAADYTPSFELITRLVMLQARDGMLKQSLDWIIRDDDDADNPPHQAQSSSQHAANLYATLLTHLKSSDPKNSQAVDMVLSHMQSNKVAVTTGIFNALIGIQVRRGAVSQAFSLYDVLVTLSRSQPIRPDSFTYGSLFSALQSLRAPHARSARNRRFKDTEGILPPRSLFRDLIYCHATNNLPRSRSSIVTTSLLNLALRTFLTLQDNAAAFVVIRSFSVHHMKPNLRTYYIVLKLLMDRIRYDLWRTRRRGETRWGDHMLGITWQDVSSVKVDNSLAEAVLAMGTSGSGRPVSMPTLAQIDGEEPLPEHKTLDILPLERILKKAVLADVSLQEHPGTPTGPQLVSQALRLAKQDMLPPRAALNERKGDLRQSKNTDVISRSLVA